MTGSARDKSDRFKLVVSLAGIVYPRRFDSRGSLRPNTRNSLYSRPLDGAANEPKLHGHAQCLIIRECDRNVFVAI